MSTGSLTLSAHADEVEVFRTPDGRWWLESGSRPRLELGELPQVVPVGAHASHIAFAARHRYGDTDLLVSAGHPWHGG